jgi:sulfur carrier protein
LALAAWRNVVAGEHNPGQEPLARSSSYDVVAMNVRVNGKEISVKQPCTVRELLERFELDRAACAVEVNRSVVPKRRHEAHMLSEGDVVEFVTLVGGG